MHTPFLIITFKYLEIWKAEVKLFLEDRPKESLRFLVLGWLFFVNLFFCQPGKYVIHVVYAVNGTRPNFPYTKYAVSEKPHKLGKRS